MKMQLNLEKSADSTLIHSVRESEHGFEIHIGEQTYRSSVLVSDHGVSLWQVRSLQTLTVEDFARLAALPGEVILLGTGKTIGFPDSSLTRPLVDQQKGLEVMDTAAACRTYNILLSDGRPVSAALII